MAREVCERVRDEPMEREPVKQPPAKPMQKLADIFEKA
jgi:hypothetical protein